MAVPNEPINKDALGSVKAAAAWAVDAQYRRDVAIRYAVAQGHTYRAVAEAAGLSHQRVSQIINREESQ